MSLSSTAMYVLRTATFQMPLARPSDMRRNSPSRTLWFQPRPLLQPAMVGNACANHCAVVLSETQSALSRAGAAC